MNYDSSAAPEVIDDLLYDEDDVFSQPANYSNPTTPLGDNEPLGRVNVNYDESMNPQTDPKDVLYRPIELYTPSETTDAIKITSSELV